MVPAMPADAPFPDRLRRELERVVGAGHVLTDPALRAGFERDWTGRFGGPAAAVVRPGTAGEVARVLAACAAARLPVIVQGGNTGLVGGGVPRGGEVVLSLRRLAAVGAVDAAGRTIDVDAGATLAATSAAADGAALRVGVDLASRDAATIGGMVATDAGGIHVLALGSMRDQVLRVDAVTARGERISDAPLEELAGSEGTLAVITRVRLRLVPRLDGHALALVGCADAAAAVALVTRLRTTVPSLHAAELMLADGLELVARHLGVPIPFPKAPPVALLLECQAATDPLDELAGALETAGVADADDVIVAADTGDRRRLWALREAHAEAIATLGIPHKLDVRVPDGALAGFLDRVGGVVATVAPGSRTIVFGHVGVGNLHVNVVGPPADATEVDERVLRLVAECGGDVVGEHGAGIAKAAWLPLSRSPEELARAAARKRAWDPDGVLAPGVIAGARIPPLPSAR
jgi:FAD/FMN-containing dehydrogenase